MKRVVLVLAAVQLLVFDACAEVPAETLAAEVARDLVRPVRPGGVNGQEFWNAHADWFMYPPSFDFRSVAGAVRYRFTVLDDQHVTRTFEAETPGATLAPVWPDVRSRPISRDPANHSPAATFRRTTSS